MKIALEAKLKKQALYSKEGELELQVQTLETMKKNLKSLDKYPSNFEPSEAILRFLDDNLQKKNKKKASETSNFSHSQEAQGFSSFTAAFETKNKPKSLFKKPKEIMKTEPADAQKKSLFLPNLEEPPKQKAFITEVADASQFFNKTLNKSKISFSKFQLTKDSKFLQNLQGSIHKKSSLTLILPKLRDSIAEQNNQALNSLEFQLKAFQKQYNQILDKK